MFSKYRFKLFNNNKSKMKAFYILLIIGATFAYDCFKEHITIVEKGIYEPKDTGRGSCKCPNQLVPRINDIAKICNCLDRDEIISCFADSKCEASYSMVGCENK